MIAVRFLFCSTLFDVAPLTQGVSALTTSRVGYTRLQTPGVVSFEIHSYAPLIIFVVDVVHCKTSVIHLQQLEGNNMTDDVKGTFINVRVKTRFKDRFNRKARKFGTPANVLREILEAFVDGRLEITSPSNNSKESLYVNRNED